MADVSSAVQSHATDEDQAAIRQARTIQVSRPGCLQTGELMKPVMKGRRLTLGGKKRDDVRLCILTKWQSCFHRHKVSGMAGEALVVSFVSSQREENGRQGQSQVAMAGVAADSGFISLSFVCQAAKGMVSDSRSKSSPLTPSFGRCRRAAQSTAISALIHMKGQQGICSSVSGDVP